MRRLNAYADQLVYIQAVRHYYAFKQSEKKGFRHHQHRLGNFLDAA